MNTHPTHIGPSSSTVFIKRPMDFKKEFSEETIPKFEERTKFSMCSPISKSAYYRYMLDAGMKRKSTQKLIKDPHILKPKSKLYTLISKLYIVIDFVMKLKEHSYIRRPKFLQKFHFKFINDHSFDYNSYIGLTKSSNNINGNRRNSLLSIFESNGNKIANGQIFRSVIARILNYKVFQCFKAIPVFNPTEYKTFILNSFYALIHLFLFAFIPLDCAFSHDIGFYLFEYSSYGLNIILPLFLFLFFSIFDMHKAYYKKGNLINAKNKIISSYVKNKLFIDSISILFIPFGAFNGFDYEFLLGLSKVFKLLFFLRILKFRTLIIEIEEFLNFGENSYNLYSLIILIFKTFFLIHLISCIWFSIGYQFRDNYEATWIQKFGIQNENSSTKYVYSLYFTVITVNTVGYGDISPTNIAETIFVIVLVTFSSILFAYNLNCIGAILNQISKKDIKYRNKMKVMNSFMEKRSISYATRNSVRKFLQYMSGENDYEDNEIEGKIIYSLPETLQESLRLESIGKPLKSIKTLCNNFSEELLRELVTLVEEKNYIPGEIILRPHIMEEKAIYFIRKGNVGVYRNTSNSQIIMHSLTKDEVYGENTVFKSNPEPFGLISHDYSSVLKINLKDIEKLAEKWPKDKETLNMIKLKINLYEEYDEINGKCSSCKKNDHDISKCNWLHRNFDKCLIFTKYLYSEEHERKWCVRKQQRKFTLKDNNELLDMFYKFRTSLMNIESESSSLNRTVHNENREQDLTNRVESEDLIDSPSLEEIYESNVIEEPMSYHRINSSRRNVDRREDNATNRNNHSLKNFLLTEVAKLNSSNIESPVEKLQFQANFERAENFTTFFPDDNLESVVKKHNEIRRRRKITINKLGDLMIPLFDKGKKFARKNQLLEREYFFHKKNLSFGNKNNPITEKKSMFKRLFQKK